MVIFAYSFPHKKSQDFILYSSSLGFRIDAVIASRPRNLSLPPKKYRYKPIHTGLLNIRLICQNLGIPYFEVDRHNSEECSSTLSKLTPDIGVIAGARILKNEAIEKFSIGIINFHPGLIPDVRGLDSLLWSIYLGIPLGVTAHFIDERVDAGRILRRKKVDIRQDDTFVDLSLRLYESQLSMLPEVLETALGKRQDLEVVSFDESGYRKSFPRELEDELPKKLEEMKKQI